MFLMFNNSLNAPPPPPTYTYSFTHTHSFTHLFFRYTHHTLYQESRTRMIIHDSESIKTGLLEWHPQMNAANYPTLDLIKNRSTQRERGARFLGFTVVLGIDLNFI